MNGLPRQVIVATNRRCEKRHADHATTGGYHFNVSNNRTLSPATLAHYSTCLLVGNISTRVAHCLHTGVRADDGHRVLALEVVEHVVHRQFRRVGHVDDDCRAEINSVLITDDLLLFCTMFSST